MVADVATYLNGRGHRNIGAAAAGLATAEDRDVVEYCLTNDLIVVTFDLDFRDAVLRAGCRCLCIRTPELSARERLAAQYKPVTRILREGGRLATVPAQGDAFEGRRPAAKRAAAAKR
jgi:predicted nuclease of predicted toxin-antitoxin system